MPRGRQRERQRNREREGDRQTVTDRLDFKKSK